MDNFLCKHNIFINVSPFNKAYLIGRDDSGNNWSQSCTNDLGDDLADEIAKLIGLNCKGVRKFHFC